MKEYKRKYIIRNLIYSKGMIFILLSFFIFMSFRVFDIYIKYNVTKQNSLSLIAEEQALSEKKKDSENRLEKINTERGKEEYIRETFPVKKSGEEVVVIYSESPATYKIDNQLSFFDKLKKWYNEITIFNNN